jgi:hypothetical protein
MAEKREREWEQQQMSTALLGETIDPKSIQQQHKYTTQTKKFPPTPALRHWNSSARALEFLPGIIKEPEAIYSFLIYLSSVAVLLYPTID